MKKLLDIDSNDVENLNFNFNTAILKTALLLEELLIIQQIKVEKITTGNIKHLDDELLSRQKDYNSHKFELSKNLSELQAMIRDTIPKKDRTPAYIKIAAVASTTATLFQLLEFINHWIKFLPS